MLLPIQDYYTELVKINFKIRGFICFLVLILFEVTYYKAKDKGRLGNSNSITDLLIYYATLLFKTDVRHVIMNSIRA